MKKISLLLIVISAALNSAAQQYGSLWQFNNPGSNSKPLLNTAAYKTVTVDENALSSYLSGITKDPAAPSTISLPGPDGSLRVFYIWETELMEHTLAQKYSSIHTYTASAVDNHLVTAKIDYTRFGFHAMIADGTNSFFIDPYGKTANGTYISYYRRDYRGNTASKAVCGISEAGAFPGGPDPTYLTSTGLPPMRYRINGNLRRTYRLALACTGEYAVAVAGPSPSKGDVLAKMITTLNRVNSVYERDLAITMQLVANDDTLIFLNPSTDPYSDGNAFSMLTQNQSTIDARIKTANYDIGHVFGTGGGGSGTGLGVAFHGVCQGAFKAQGVTGRPNPSGDAFDIDFVAHEMGHQYGAEHSFNSNGTGDCSGNAWAGSAYEPGSGSTIMAYAGICGTENIQSNTDPYFHSKSLEEITSYVQANTCASLSSTGNVNATIPAFTASYNIPYLTAFELTAPELSDPTAEEITYCWEQRDLGDFGKTIAQTRLNGPQFRSFSPTTSRTRIFPSIDSLLKSVFISKQEKIADTSRTFCFRLTERDIFQGFGCFNFPDDSIHLNVIYTGSPFKVIAPNASSNWASGSTQTIRWNVSNTNIAPINCANVDIFLSTDGGYTFPTTLAANTPNDGNELVTLPNVNTTNLRIKVKGVDNVFFAISHTTPPTHVRPPYLTPVVNVTPVPAAQHVEVQFVQAGEVSYGRVFSTTGQLVWSGKIVDHEVIDVSTWAKGIYFLKLRNENSIDVVRPIIVE